MSVVIDIDPSTSQFYIAACPYEVYSKVVKEDVERFITKWNNSGNTTSIVFEEENGVPTLDSYRFSVHISGFAPKNGQDPNVWMKYIKFIRENTSDIWDMIDKM